MEFLTPGPCALPRRPCPICGDGSPCLVRETGDVECAELGRAGRALSPPRGWRRGAELGGSLCLVLYERTADAPEPRSARRSPDEDRRRDKAIGDARRQWESASAAGRDHPRLRAYLQARGIPLELLPDGRVPAELAFAESCPDVWIAAERRWASWPAMVARVAAIERAEGGRHRLVQSGAHRTFLARDGSPAKRPAAEGNAKKMLGACGGRAIWLRREFPGGVLVLAEGIETSLACMAGAQVGALCYMAADYLAKFALPEALVRPGGPVHTIVIAADLDSGRLGGADKVKAFTDRIREALPLGPQEAEYIASLPTGQRWAQFGAELFRHAHPHLTVEVRAPSIDRIPALAEKGLLQTDGELVKGLKKIDWLDVLNAAGPDAVRAGLLDGLDLAEAARRAAAPAPAEPAEPPRTRVDAPDSSGGVGGTPPWVARSEDDMPIIEEGALTRARRFLWERCRREGAGRFTIARWAGRWLLFDGRAYAAVEDEQLRSIVWHWLDGFKHWRREKLVRVNPTGRAVEDVMRAMAADTAVLAQDLPRWLDPVLDRSGRPSWGAAPNLAAPAAACAGVRPDPRSQIVFPGGRLDLRRLCNKRLPVAERTRLEPHTPDFFTTTCLPYDLPAQDLAGLLAGTADRDEVYARLCPKFYGWLADASEGDPGWEDQCLKMLGDTIGGDRSIEKIFAVVGLARGGKGILEDAIAAVLGEDNVASLTTENLVREFGLAHCVGKAAAVMPDAHLDSIAQNRGAVEVLKAWSGQGRIPVRDIYESTRTHKMSARLWIFCNEEPELRDNSAALAGRFCWLPIHKGYQGAEDLTIKAAVPAEAPGIMLLALEGAIRLWSMPRRVIEQCRAGLEIYEEFEEQSAPLKKFVSTWLRYVPQDDGTTAGLLTPEELHRAYELFCEHDEHRQPLGFRKFMRSVKWHMRPFGYTQGGGDNPTRRRHVAGWMLGPAGETEELIAQRARVAELWQRRPADAPPARDRDGRPRWPAE